MKIHCVSASLCGQPPLLELEVASKREGIALAMDIYHEEFGLILESRDIVFTHAGMALSQDGRSVTMTDCPCGASFEDENSVNLIPDGFPADDDDTAVRQWRSIVPKE